jgi:hypothetical protein
MMQKFSSSSSPARHLAMFPDKKMGTKLRFCSTATRIHEVAFGAPTGSSQTRDYYDSKIACAVDHSG